MKLRRPSPELAVAIASAAWGLFWIPLRAFERHGLDPAWVTLTQFLAPLAILMPFAVLRWRRRQPTGIQQYRTGLLIGAAVAMYLVSLLLTDVTRALILFYAMPAWGTVLEVGLMGRPLTRWRGFSLLLSLAGMLTILGVGDPLSLSMNLGDLMALLSGFLFALGAMRVRQAPETSVFEQVLAFFLYGSLAALALSLLPLAALGQPPSLEQLITLAPWLVLIAVGFLIPVMWGIYWGSRHVDPGRLGILLQIEVVVGIGSAALLAGEPFGVRQAIGAVLVISAGLVEVIGNRKGTPADA
ncbi:MAG: DMT family transporter [Anaerolineales bacterium]|nr:DMT family transporter [Anaerolineales bacterium]